MKVQGTYESVVKGVSQQAPADRLEGQHGEVVNMISDPVRGLVRRNGMVLETTDMRATTVNDETVALAVEDAMSYRTFSFRSGGTDYDVLYRSRARVGPANSDAHLPPVMLYERVYDQEQFMAVRWDPADEGLNDYFDGGFSAVTAVGEYVLFAGNATMPTQSVEDRWDTYGNKYKAAIWVRAGGYSRTYRIKATRAPDHKVFEVEYTTPPAQYPGILDFSTIEVDPSDPQYQAEVNKIQAAYDTAVNQHIATASAAIVPAAIAQKLKEAFETAGWVGASYWDRIESTLLSAEVEKLEVDDGGTGEYMRETLSEETSPNELPIAAHFGKIVRINPAGSDPYYMEAHKVSEPQPGSPTIYGRVYWRETAGQQQTPTNMFMLGKFHAGLFYLGSTPERLQQTILLQAGVTVDVPKYAPSEAGDTTTSMPPFFFGKTVTMLSMFQDRLVIGAGGTVSMSKRGDYFSFYRSTVLTQPDDDPVELSSVASADDTIRKVTAHEMNLFVHGDKRHYIIPGRQPVTPTNGYMGVMWEVQNAAKAQPVSNGANLFILKEEAQVGASRLLQVQPGLYQDIPQLQDVSQQLRDYINGFPVEIVAFLNPGTVFVRTEFVPKSRYGFPRARRQGIYMYQYTDQGDQRVIDAWSAWEWSEHLGRPIGIVPAGFGDTLRIYTFVQGTNELGEPVRAVNVLRASIRPDPSGLPYLDGLTTAERAEVYGLFTKEAKAAVRAQVYTSPGAQFSYEEPLVGHDPDTVLPDGPNWTVGDTNPTVIDPIRWAGVNGWMYEFNQAYGPFSQDRRDTIFTGVQFYSYVEVTNPFVREQGGKADTMGRLVLTRFHVITTRTAGMRASWKDYDGQVYTLDYGSTYDQINYKQSVFIGRDTKDVQIRLAAKDWLPLTINGISWQGNWFGTKQKA